MQVSSPPTNVPAPSSPPNAMLTATGVAAAQVQRTGASRRTAMAVPTTRSSTIPARRSAKAAEAATRASGTADRAKSAGSAGR